MRFVLRTLIVSVAAGGLLTACDGGGSMDASDASDASEIATDVQNDVTMDAGNDVVEDAPADVPVDVPVDSPACTGTAMHETEFPHAMNGIWVAEYDAQLLSMGATDTVVFASTSPTAATPMVSGTCALYGDLFGGPPRSNAVQRNYGPMTVTQGTAVTTLTYDSTMNGYTGDTSLATPMFPGTDATISITGGPDGLAGVMGTVRQPDRWNATIQNFPAILSRTADTVIPFTAPAGVSSDTTVLLELTRQADFGQTIFCAVPACAHQFTVPMALASQLTSGDSYFIYVGTQNHADVGTTDQPLRFWMSTGILAPISVE